MKLKVLSHLLLVVVLHRSRVQRRAQTIVQSIHFCATLDQQLGHFDAWEECVLALFKQILALQRIVLHHRQVQEGVACR